MKKVFLALALAIVCALSACAAPSTAQTYLDSIEIDPQTLDFCACVIHEDGTQETTALIDELHQALLSAFPEAKEAVETEDTPIVSAEQADAHHLIAGDLHLYVDASRTLLTFVVPVEQQGQTVLTQKHFVLGAPLPDLFPHPELAPVLQALSTLDARIAAADIAKLEAEGEEMEFSAYSDPLPLAVQSNAYALQHEDALIVGVQAMSPQGEYRPMLVQEAELVDTTLIVRVAVSADEGCGPITMADPGTVQEVWFVESGTIIEIADPLAA